MRRVVVRVLTVLVALTLLAAAIWPEHGDELFRVLSGLVAAGAGGWMLLRPDLVRTYMAEISHAARVQAAWKQTGLMWTRALGALTIYFGVSLIWPAQVPQLPYFRFHL
ncbi:MAG TPA: hypothetical protein VJ476_16275 [Rhizomicrobium sp.]|nr:hypothetical protein [Rhizomicrobium sp.]